MRAPLTSLVVAGRMEGDLHAIYTRSASLLHTRVRQVVICIGSAGATPAWAHTHGSVRPASQPSPTNIVPATSSGVLVRAPRVS